VAEGVKQATVMCNCENRTEFYAAETCRCEHISDSLIKKKHFVGMAVWYNLYETGYSKLCSVLEMDA
jgi:hypothetical protein